MNSIEIRYVMDIKFWIEYEYDIIWKYNYAYDIITKYPLVSYFQL